MRLRLALAAATLAAANYGSPASRALAAEDPSGAVAAVVNGAPVTQEEVARALDQALAGRRVTPAERTQAEAEVLTQLIDRHLVEAFLKQAGDWPAAAQVEQAVKQIRLQVDQQKNSWQDFLAEKHMHDAGFRQQIAWRLGWEKYLQSRLTDERLEAYFQAHRPDFDGTQVRVSHLLLRTETDSPAALATTVEAAAGIRADIAAGKISFDDAVKKFSAGPSRDRAGDLGFIPRHGVMVEAFARAAFQLHAGDISPPVVTPFGVHLIKVLEVRPGNRQASDVRDQVRPAAAQALFQELAGQQRATAKIFLGNSR